MDDCRAHTCTYGFYKIWVVHLTARYRVTWRGWAKGVGGRGRPSGSYGIGPPVLCISDDAREQEQISRPLGDTFFECMKWKKNPPRVGAAYLSRGAVSYGASRRQTTVKNVHSTCFSRLFVVDTKHCPNETFGVFAQLYDFEYRVRLKAYTAVGTTCTVYKNVTTSEKYNNNDNNTVVDCNNIIYDCTAHDTIRTATGCTRCFRDNFETRQCDLFSKPKLFGILSDSLTSSAQTHQNMSTLNTESFDFQTIF